MEEDHNVTLRISSHTDEIISLTSAIRLFNLADQNPQIREIDYNRGSDVYLGRLSQLRDSFLVVDTFASNPSDNQKAKSVRVTYEIKYGSTMVEQTAVESEFIERSVGFLGFRFRFCPRHPFC